MAEDLASPIATRTRKQKSEKKTKSFRSPRKAAAKITGVHDFARRVSDAFSPNKDRDDASDDSVSTLTQESAVEAEAVTATAPATPAGAAAGPTWDDATAEIEDSPGALAALAGRVRGLWAPPVCCADGGDPAASGERQIPAAE